MKVLLIGATGFLGSAIHGSLLASGHHVTATYHRGPAPRWPERDTSWRPAALESFSVAQWAALLEGRDAVINCAGVLQDSPFESTAHVHAKGLKTLISVCEAAR